MNRDRGKTRSRDFRKPILYAAVLIALSLPALAQQPGQSAQVHTGTSRGVEIETRFRALLADHEYFRMADELDQLPAEEAQFYRGILANRDNKEKSSIALLEPLLAKVAASGNAAKEKLLRKTLAEDYLREGDLAEAAKAYER